MKTFDHLYILKDRKPVVVHSIQEWGNWFENSIKDKSRTVAKTEIKKGTLSTVFLAMSLTKNLFETCWFPNKGLSVVLDQYETWEEAEEGHQKYLDVLKKK